MRPDDATLLDILKAAKAAVEFNEGMGKNAFLADRKTQSAVLHQLLVLGEAAKRISEGFRTAHADIPIKMIAGMRDKLIHEYNDVDLDEVWKTVADDIPNLIEKITPIAPREKSEPMDADV